MKPNTVKSALRFALGALSLGILTACGGGDAGDPAVADGGIRGTGSSVGPVSGFGSVFVNGIEFFTDGILNRTVDSDDGITEECATRSEEFCLREGMILRVEGQWRDDGQGTADSLSYDDTLRGPIDDILPDPSGAGEFVTIVVMGQQVRVDSQTVLHGTTFATLLEGTGTGTGVGVGDNVRVSAWRQADGSYRARFVGILTVTPVGVEPVELEGSVSDVNPGPNQFIIGTITVEYDPDTVDFGSELTEADLSFPNVLEVEGSLTGNLLTASSIDRDDARRFARGGADDIQFTATIDTPYEPDDRPGEFTMSGLTVRVTTATELDDGLVLADLKRTDLLIQVEGNFVSDTVVEADEIGLRESDAKVEGAIERAFSVGSQDSFVVGGVTVKTTPLTVFIREDGGLQAIESLPVGAQVEVEGLEVSDGSTFFIEAFKVELEADQSGDDANEFEVEGRLRFITPTPAANGLSILGLTISDLGAEYRGDDPDPRGAIVDAFNAAETSDPVILEVRYSNTPAGFVADRVELD